MCLPFDQQFHLQKFVINKYMDKYINAKIRNTINTYQ